MLVTWIFAFSFKRITLREQVGFQVVSTNVFRWVTGGLRPDSLRCYKLSEQGKGSVCGVQGKIPLPASADGAVKCCTASK